jgi:hypothetical protein
MHFAELIVCMFIIYAAFGAIFAIAFVLFGVDRVDPTAKTLGFRLLILPGVAALWPLLLGRWVGA